MHAGQTTGSSLNQHHAAAVAALALFNQGRSVASKMPTLLLLAVACYSTSPPCVRADSALLGKRDSDKHHSCGFSTAVGALQVGAGRIPPCRLCCCCSVAVSVTVIVIGKLGNPQGSQNLMGDQ